MTNEVIKIKIASTINGEEIDLSVAELGALLTAINRCFNQLPLEGVDAEVTSIHRGFDRFNFEPALVELKISSISRGCVELEIITKALDILNGLPEPQRTLILGALGSGAWDISKIFTKHFARATKRIALASSGKVISVAITSKHKTFKFIANFGKERNIHISSGNSTPDDIQ